MQDVKVRRIAGPQHAIGVDVGMRVAAFTRDGVHALHMLGAKVIEDLADQSHTLVLPHPRSQHPVQLLIRGIDHHAGSRQQGDLILRLDLPDLLHQALAVDHGEAFRAQRLQHGDLDHVHSQRRPVQLPRFQLDPDFAGHICGALGVGAPQRGNAGA